MNKKYRALKDFLIQEHPMCEVCGDREGVEVGHCLYHIHKSKFNPIYDSYENCQSCCHQCNMGKANSRKEKKRHWKKRCDELGKEHMKEWNLTVPKSRREGFE